MTYEECMSLVEAYEESVLIEHELTEMQTVCDVKKLMGRASEISDAIKFFITGLINESPIGDGRRNDG